jgi:sucrose phosphorylase
MILYKLVDMIQKRINEKAFHPNAAQKVFHVSNAFFTLLRTSVDRQENILAITNVTTQRQLFELDIKKEGLNAVSWCDVLSGKTFKIQNKKLSLEIEPYGVLWLKVR